MSRPVAVRRCGSHSWRWPIRATRYIVFEPTYANYFGFAATAGIQPVALRSSPNDGYHLPPRAEIQGAITPRTRAICIANPNNPTGTVYDRSELEVLVELAIEHELFIISDETYRELIFDGLVHHSMLTFEQPEVAQRVIIADSVSKRFSATGIRIGCILSRNGAVMDAVGRFAQARLASPTVEQLAVVPMLRNPGGVHDLASGRVREPAQRCF